MEYPSLNYPCRQTPHLDPRSSHHHRHGDLFYPDASGLYDFNATETLTPINRLPPDATDFNIRMTNEQSLLIEETRGRTPSRWSVSRTSIEGFITLYKHSPSQSHVAGPRHVSNQDDQSLERRNYEEILHRQLSDFLGLQGPAQDRYHCTNTPPLSGPAPEGPGHGQDLISDTLYSDREDIGYAAHLFQPSAPIFDANTAAPPTLSSTNVATPLNFPNTGDQQLLWSEQLEAYAYDIFPDSVPSQETTHGRNWPTDTAPFNSHPPQTTGYGPSFASDASRSNGEDVCYAAHPLQSSTPFLDSNSAAVPQLFNPPYTSTPADDSPKIKSERYEPPGTSPTSPISATHRDAPILSNHINSPLLGTSNPLHRPHKISKLNSFDPSTETPIPRRRRPCRLLPNQPYLSDVDLCFPPSHPHVASSESVNTSGAGAPTQGQPIDHTAKTECSGSSNVSNKDEFDEDDFFNLFIDMKGLIEEPSNDCQASSLDDIDALNFINKLVPDALESATAQNTAGQPIENTGLEPQPQPKREYRKRTFSTAFPITTTASEAPQPETKPRKNTKPNPVRKNPSCRIRRADPKSRYWCADATCHASRDRDFAGFVTSEDTRRHLLVHQPPSFVCRLPHRNGADFWARRKDNLEA